MRNAQKKGEKSSSTRIGVALIGGLGGSMLLTLLACGILAGMISSEKVPEEWAAGGTMVP